MVRRSLRHIVTALVLLVAFACQETWALAGTTGGLSGAVIDATSSAPVSGAVVTVTSPSQTSSQTTDASGRFNFLNLEPDTYTVSVSKDQYTTQSTPGQVVFADTVQTLTVRLQKTLQTIARITATGGSALVKSGTTSDVYSVNAAGQAAAAALGGGGSLNSAYSAIATVPGAYVIPNQTGYYQTVHIRGGDYDSVGYEFDGVPVNRSFDNYPSSSASSLGNAEVQVYTGATPANSEGQGLAGYINQVIRTGTYPGFGDAQLGIGTPAFYHRAAVEVGGATPDRLFSYYVGVAGYNQAFNYINNQNGSNYDSFAGAPLTPLFVTCSGKGAVPDPQNYQSCYAANNGFGPYGPGGYALGPVNYGLLGNISSRDVVVNTHFAIPHHHDAGRDDIQVLWDSSSLLNGYYQSTNDIASTDCPGATSGTQCANEIGLGQPKYINGYQWGCGTGQLYASAAAIPKSCVTNYLYPSSGQTALGQYIPNAQEDTAGNNQEIVKLQYTHNMGSSAFFRVYGYTYYSNWLLWGPQCSYADYVCPTSPDYELSSHTRGLSAQLQDQINAQNLVSLQASYTTANSTRDNNTQMFNGGGIRADGLVAVNASDPYAGYCFTGAAAGTVTTCNPNAGAATFGTWSEAQSGTVPALPTSCAVPGQPQLGNKCAYLAAENSLWATYNTVQPQFFATSLTDEFRPSDRWLINAGVRLDSFTFNGSNTDYGPARQFWFNAFNLDSCLSNANGAYYDKVSNLGLASPTDACPAGYHSPYLQNVSNQTYTFNVWQPRLGGTYTVNSDSVIRFSFGRYTEAPNTAYEQYNTLEEDLPFALLGPSFAQYGRYTPGTPIYPPTSLNYDVSFEKHLHGTDWSFKLTPFLRQTQDQVQQFFLNQKTNFVSGLNVGSQTSEGLELQVQKGDFSKNGISGLLSFAYTNSYIKYGTLPNGLTIIAPINANIQQYNAFTSYCHNNPKDQRCGGGTAPIDPTTNTPIVAAPCYTTKGAPVTGTCTGADVANPYWNSPVQGLITASQFPTYDLFPSGINSSASSYNVPYVATLLLNYKHDKFAITPSFQFNGGEKYGAPETTPGVDPQAGCGVLAGYTTANGGRYNALTCAGAVVIPDQYTGTFDGLGAFTQPNEFIMNLQLSYEVSPRITLTGTLANIVNTCWGGTKAPWTYVNGNICSYGTFGAGEIDPVGNIYNPNSTIQQYVKYPYGPSFGNFNPNSNSTLTPFQFYVSAKVKL